MKKLGKLNLSSNQMLTPDEQNKILGGGGDLSNPSYCPNVYSVFFDGTLCAENTSQGQCNCRRLNTAHYDEITEMYDTTDTCAAYDPDTHDFKDVVIYYHVIYYYRQPQICTGWDAYGHAQHKPGSKSQLKSPDKVLIQSW